ncbi:RNA polymerase subunit sigma-70 [Falsibacillus albus]|uniref:RNA polymerase subunit sigma-70 n=1 Tax=Falsibacillus albus TaxID=2478915 RepID=A0A3L7K4Z8_9BACI|nr:RNA polymerase subunit sigma-70 [Falsibacillus albus]RLQ98098.1 RNA polymerase subunit sigma-70 [Falsibacillus albus]
MRFGDKQSMNIHGDRLYGMDFHQFIERESEATTIELASEFGLTLRDVQNLKRKLERS